VLVSFNGTDGANPFSSLIADANGDLFGTTKAGGASGDGVVFEIAKTANGYAGTPAVLVSFNGTDGANPYGGLVADANGDLFGTTELGGASGGGVVFEIAKTANGYAGTPAVLVSFNGTDGADPFGGLVADANGDLFGTTEGGGASGDGTVFELSPGLGGYVLSTVSFNGTDGANPIGGLVADANGDLFGTTADSVPSGVGTVFEVLCFLAGTGIATPLGEVPVEALRAGDLVLTAAGSAVPLTWIGRQSVTAATKLDRDLHYPVRICPDAVAPGIPHRDLLVTGDHAVFVDGHLIPARMLVNGASIRAEHDMTAFTYFHLELERHDLLLADGLAAESYLDTGNRHMFSDDNVAGRVPPGRASAAACYAERGVAPLTLAPALVEPVWRGLAARAAVVAFAPESAGQHGLHLLAAGRRILPIHIAGDRAMFVVPAGVREAVLVSAAARPSDHRPWLDDRRRLGVMVGRVRVRAASETTDIALDGPLLGAGWHDVEPAGRWTAGRGVLALPACAEVSILELTIAAAMADRAAQREAA
jgi:uncharacterized repeat protein (TIGR03803 family)